MQERNDSYRLNCERESAAELSGIFELGRSCLNSNWVRELLNLAFAISGNVNGVFETLSDSSIKKKTKQKQKRLEGSFLVPSSWTTSRVNSPSYKVLQFSQRIKIVQKCTPRYVQLT